MRRLRNIVVTENDTYHRQFAMCLVRTLGRDGAIDICVQNFWDGTLNIIKNEKRHYR